MLLTLCALFAGYFPFTNYTFDTKFGMTSMQSAYGQAPGPSDPGNAGSLGNTGGPGEPGNVSGSSGPDPSAGDNSTSPLNPGDISSGIGNNTNDTTHNATATKAVPEFPITILVMLIAVLLTVVFYRIKSIKI